jgi:hypothetical protein
MKEGAQVREYAKRLGNMRKHNIIRQVAPKSTKNREAADIPMPPAPGSKITDSIAGS